MLKEECLFVMVYTISIYLHLCHYTSINLTASSASRRKNCSGQSLVGGMLLPYPRGSQATSVNKSLLKCSSCSLKSVCEQPNIINKQVQPRLNTNTKTSVWQHKNASIIICIIIIFIIITIILIKSMITHHQEAVWPITSSTTYRLCCAKRL